MAQIGDNAAERGCNAGKPRHQGDFEADFLDDGTDMQRAAPAERHADELCRIMATFDRYKTDRARHAGVGDPHDRLGRLQHVDAERLTDMRHDRPPGGLDIETRELAADRFLGVDTPEHHMRIGQGRPLIALAVAGRSRHRTGAFRPHLQQPPAIDRGNRSAAGADGRDLDHRRADDEPEIDGGLRRQRRSSVNDDGDIKRCAAEIAGDGVVVTGLVRDARGRYHAGRRT